MGNMLPRDAVQFITDLTGAGAAEVGEYADEFSLDREFHDGIREKRRAPGRKRFSYWDFSVGTTLGLVIYIICRRQKPGIFIETGVADGVSSSHILSALKKNGEGRLYSIDMPWQEEPSGWLIPDHLRHNWRLIVGMSSEKLPALLREVGGIDIFLHDSEHSYRNMRWELQTAWSALNPGGILLAHNIDNNNAFPDFCRDSAVRGCYLHDMGGIVKP